MSDVRQEIITAIGDVRFEEGATTNEIASACNPPRPNLAIRAELRRLLAEGKLEVVRVPRPSLDGCIRRVPGYRIRA